MFIFDLLFVSIRICVFQMARGSADNVKNGVTIDIEQAFAYYCHGIMLLLLKLLQTDGIVCNVSKVLILKQFREWSSDYEQCKLSFELLNGSEIVIDTCLKSAVMTGEETEHKNGNESDNCDLQMRLLFVQECLLSILLLTMNPNSDEIINKLAAIVSYLANNDDKHHKIEEFVFEWLLYMSLNHIPTKELINIGYNSKTNKFEIITDSRTNTADLDIKQVKTHTQQEQQQRGRKKLRSEPFIPDNLHFVHPNYACLALDLIVHCKYKFQQFGLCLLQNAVKKHSNRQRLANVRFLTKLINYIDCWLHWEANEMELKEFEYSSKESSTSVNERRGSDRTASSEDASLSLQATTMQRQAALIGDYTFLLSVVGTASSNHDLKSILKLQCGANAVTKKHKLGNKKTERLVYDTLVSDMLLKMLHNQNNVSSIEFEHSIHGYSFLKLAFQPTPPTVEYFVVNMFPFCSNALRFLFFVFLKLINCEYFLNMLE